jgi:hypothetical protein
MTLSNDPDIDVFAFQPPNQLLFVRQHVNPGVWVAPFDGHAADFAKASLVEPGASESDAASDGTIVSSIPVNLKYELVWVATSGAVSALSGPPFESSRPSLALSSDGKRAVLSERSQDGQDAFVVRDLVTGTDTRIPTPQGPHVFSTGGVVTWTPGGRLLYPAGGVETTKVYDWPADGSANGRDLAPGIAALVAPNHELIFIEDERGRMRLVHAPIGADIERGDSQPIPEGSRLITRTHRQSEEAMSRRFPAVLISMLTAAVTLAWGGQPLALDHVWIMVAPGAPERGALENAGFRIAPTVNRHDGQGTASVTVEFLNGFLELIYLDPTVPVSSGFEAAVAKFQRKTAWRENGSSPFGIGLRRTTSTPATLPFPTWRITAEWMSGGFMEMLTPRDMANAPSYFVASHPVDEQANRKLAADPLNGAMFRHTNGAQLLTSVRVVGPDAADFPPAARYLDEAGVTRFEVGTAWLLDVTLDAGQRAIVRDLRPDLPLIIRY